MRKWLRAGKAFVVFCLAVACALCALVLLHAPVFERGEGYEIYYGASSSALVKTTSSPALDKALGGVRGESVRYDGDRREEIEARYRAKLLFTEEVCGVTNYYYHSPLLGEGVEVNGATVNLHVAVSASRTAAGTPLIFGGF